VPTSYVWMVSIIQKSRSRQIKNMRSTILKLDRIACRFQQNKKNAPDIIIKRSTIAGKGVFANKNIANGVSICFLEGELCTLDEIMKKISDGIEALSDPLGVDEEMYLDLDEISRTYNHSCNPNSYIKGKSELIAMRDIQAGEEITYDYSTTMSDNREKIEKAGGKLWTHECNCKSKNCRKIIDQFITLPKERQDFYLSRKLMPDYMLKKFG